MGTRFGALTQLSASATLSETLYTTCDHRCFNGAETGVSLLMQNGVVAEYCDIRSTCIVASAPSVRPRVRPHGGDVMRSLLLVTTVVESVRIPTAISDRVQNFDYFAITL